MELQQIEIWEIGPDGKEVPGTRQAIEINARNPLWKRSAANPGLPAKMVGDNAEIMPIMLHNADQTKAFGIIVTIQEPITL